MHTVSKMILNDWLRGKIPYYVKPPFDDEIKPATTADKPKKLPVPGIEQIFSKIRVEAEFMEDDLKRAADEEATDEVLLQGEHDLLEKDSTAQDVEEDVPDWDQVFESVVGDTVEGIPEDEQAKVKLDQDEEQDEDQQDEESGSEVEDDEEVAATTEKKTRMKTNKRKVGTHFYETANVKNRNRIKKAKTPTSANPKRVEKRLKGDGKRRN